MNRKYSCWRWIRLKAKSVGGNPLCQIMRDCVWGCHGLVLKVGAFNEAKFCFIFKPRTLSNTLQRRETWTVWTDDPHGKEIWTWRITFWSFCQVGGKMTTCYSWLHKSSLGKIPMAQFCGHCLYTESTHACHSVVHGFTGMDICVGSRHLLPIRLLVLFLGWCWHWGHFGGNSVSDLWRRSVVNGQEWPLQSWPLALWGVRGQSQTGEAKPRLWLEQLELR